MTKGRQQGQELAEMPTQSEGQTNTALLKAVAKTKTLKVVDMSTNCFPALGSERMRGVGGPSPDKGSRKGRLKLPGITILVKKREN